MINFFKYFAFFAFVAGCFVAPDASAQALGGTNDVFTTVLTRLVATFKNVRSVIFVIGVGVEGAIRAKKTKTAKKANKAEPTENE